MTDARMVATNTHRRSLAVQSVAPRVARMTCSSHGLALGLIKTHCLLPRVAPHYPSLKTHQLPPRQLDGFGNDSTQPTPCSIQLAALHAYARDAARRYA